MTLQILVDGLVYGAMIGLGAVGVTLTYSILRFANFAHGEFIAWGAYFALAVSTALGFVSGALTAPIAPFSFGWALPIGAAAALVLTGLLALALDAVLFGRLRAGNATIIIMVMASFGASLALRSLLEFLFTARPAYFTNALQIAMRLGWGMRATPDQLLSLVVAAAAVAAVHLLLTRTGTGRAMRAVSENSQLAAVAGVDVRAVVRVVWVLGAGLAAVAGVISGLLVQIRPQMGLDLLLPLFAATILGGIGSVPGAMVAGLIIGLSEAAAVQFVGAEWRAAVAFVILVAVLLLRPQGLFGRRA